MGSSSSKANALRNELEVISRKTDRLMNDENLQAYVDELYTDDAIIMPPTGTIHIGKKGIL